MPAGTPRPDLLIVGGLTIDRLADGSFAPGGSVLHATRALHRNASIEVLTVAGDEPLAQAGLTELRLLARRVVCVPAPQTIAFRHGESPRGRRSWLEPVSARIVGDQGGAGLRARRVLFAPVAGEIGPELLRAWSGPATRAAILQGWLREAGPDGAVVQVGLHRLDERLAGELDRLDLLVASREDLLAEGSRPAEQLAALRRRLPRPPLLVVTDGVRGARIDLLGEEPRSLPPPRVVDTVADVGAGDVFAASLLLALGAGLGAVERAMEATARWLEVRTS